MRRSFSRPLSLLRSSSFDTSLPTSSGRAWLTRRRSPRGPLTITCSSVRTPPRSISGTKPGSSPTGSTGAKKQRQIKPDVAALKLVPSVRVRAEDLMANPPISPEDWRKIHTWIREVFIRESDRVNNHRSPYWRRCFYAFVMTGKNSGRDLRSCRA